MGESFAMRHIRLNSPCVQTYLILLQGVVNRMANNSTQCKAFCVAAVAAIIALSSSMQRSGIALLSFAIIPICCILDCNYLSLERAYRKKYNDTCKMIREDNLSIEALFDLTPPRGYTSLYQIWLSFNSWSVWAIYFVLSIVVATTWYITNGGG